MKAKVNIELFDNTKASTLDGLGITFKFLEVCYKAAFEQFLTEFCGSGLEHTVSVEIEDNTVN